MFLIEALQRIFRRWLLISWLLKKKQFTHQNLRNAISLDKALKLHFCHIPFVDLGVSLPCTRSRLLSLLCIIFLLNEITRSSPVSFEEKKTSAFVLVCFIVYLDCPNKSNNFASRIVHHLDLSQLPPNLIMQCLFHPNWTTEDFTQKWMLSISVGIQDKAT